STIAAKDDAMARFAALSLGPKHRDRRRDRLEPVKGKGLVGAWQGKSRPEFVRGIEREAVASDINDPRPHLIASAETQARQARGHTLERRGQSHVGWWKRRRHRYGTRSRDRETPALPQKQRLRDVVRRGRIWRRRPRLGSVGRRLDQRGLRA